jgi:hypothetical protein
MFKYLTNTVLNAWKFSNINIPKDRIFLNLKYSRGSVIIVIYDIMYYCGVIAPTRELLKFRNLKTRDCEIVVSDVLPYPRFAPHRTLLGLLGYAVNIGLRNSKEELRDLRDVTRNNTQRCVLRTSDSSVYRRDWRQCSAVRVSIKLEEKCSQWLSDAARSTQARQRIGIRSTLENKRFAGEELTQCVYSNIESTVSNCKFRLVHNQ